MHVYASCHSHAGRALLARQTHSVTLHTLLLVTPLNAPIEHQTSTILGHTIKRLSFVVSWTDTFPLLQLSFLLLLVLEVPLQQLPEVLCCRSHVEWLWQHWLV